MELHSDYHTWNQCDPADVCKPEQVYGAQAIFPAHNTLRLHPVNFEANSELQTHCADLHTIAEQYVIYGAVFEICWCIL